MLGGILQKAHEGRAIGERTQESASRTTATRSSATRSCAAELGEHPSDVALAWLLAQPGVTAPIIGPRTIAQLDGNLNALDVASTTQTMKQLDEIWPGPGGAAPEAYAW